MAINDNELYALKGKQVKDLANRIESKQDALTAGANISISEQNEISATIPSAFQTIFYANLGETGTSRHIYKNSDMTGTASAQDILDANNAGQVILRMTTSADPTQFSDAYLQNTYVGENDYQFLFLDERTYREYDATATTDTTFYYSSTEVQLKLTAGTNVSISGNTISATDTTYSDFVGTDSTAIGTAGLVPAPAITDANKFLKSDGTWANTGGGATVYDSTISLTNNGSALDSFTVNASSNKTIALDYPTITMTSTDPGEGSPLSANSFIAVYNAS